MIKRGTAEEFEAIKEEHPNIMVAFLPTPGLYRRFRDWVDWQTGADDSGNILGHCPLHDGEKQMESSAEYNFHKGIMRCQGDPPCHIGKRAMSLTNVIAGMVDGTR